MNRSNHRFSARLNITDDRVQRGLLQCLGGIELANICAAGKTLAAANQDNGANRSVIHSALYTFNNGRSGREAQAIDRWVIECDDSNVTVLAE